MSFRSFWKGLDLPPDLLPRPLGVLDIGARGGVQWPWDQISPRCLDITLVEPDPEEVDRLRRDWESTRRGTVLPAALWREETTLQLHVNRSPGTSSVFPSNFNLLNQFPDARRFEAVSIIDVPTQTIDGVAAANGFHDIDIAKIDVQGAELAILEGGFVHLSHNLVALELEVEFCPLYVGQPLFSDVDSFVRGMGLELWDLHTTYWKYERGRHVPGPQKGRLVCGDALYFRPLQGLESWLSAMAAASAQSKAVMLVVTALVYGYVDYATAVLTDPTVARFFESGARVGLERAIRSVGRGFRLPRRGNRYLYWFFNLLAIASRTSYGDWATGGPGLGSRRRGPFWS